MAPVAPRKRRPHHTKRSLRSRTHKAQAALVVGVALRKRELQVLRKFSRRRADSLEENATPRNLRAWDTRAEAADHALFFRARGVSGQRRKQLSYAPANLAVVLRPFVVIRCPKKSAQTDILQALILGQLPSDALP